MISASVVVIVFRCLRNGIFVVCNIIDHYF